MAKKNLTVIFTPWRTFLAKKWGYKCELPWVFGSNVPLALLTQAPTGSRIFNPGILQNPGIFWDGISLRFLIWDFTKKVQDLGNTPSENIRVNFIHFGELICFLDVWDSQRSMMTVKVFKEIEYDKSFHYPHQKQITQFDCWSLTGLNIYTSNWYYMNISFDYLCIFLPCMSTSAKTIIPKVYRIIFNQDAWTPTGRALEPWAGL